MKSLNSLMLNSTGDETIQSLPHPPLAKYVKKYLGMYRLNDCNINYCMYETLQVCREIDPKTAIDAAFIFISFDNMLKDLYRKNTYGIPNDKITFNAYSDTTLADGITDNFYQFEIPRFTSYCIKGRELFSKVALSNEPAAELLIDAVKILTALEMIVTESMYEYTVVSEDKISVLIQ